LKKIGWIGAGKRFHFSKNIFVVAALGRE